MSRTRAVALAGLLVVSIFAGVVPMGALGAPNGQGLPAGSNGQGPPSFVDVPTQNTQKSTEVVHPGNPPKHALGSGNSKQGGASTGPPEHVQELLDRVPSKALSNTRVSKHANTTIVDYAATEDGELAVVVTDEVSSDGRTVAIGANVLYRTLGEAPKFATIHHESGETETTEINYSDGYAQIPISHFSTNTVTFAGQVHLTGDPAVDGTTYQYGLQDLDAVSDYFINVTGDTAYERENQSSQVGDGETIPLSIAGTADPVGPEGQAVPQIVLEGTETTSQFSTSGGPVTGGDSTTATLDGNQDPRNAEITFNGDRSETSRTVSATGVSDGGTKDYSVGGNLPAEGEEVTFVGAETTGSSTTVSGTDGDSIDPTGNIAPTSTSVTFIGKESTTQQTVSVTGASNGQTDSYTIGGNLDATGSEVTFTGNEETTSQSDSTTGDGSGISQTSLSVGGNVAPENAQVSLTGHKVSSSDYGGPGTLTEHSDNTASITITDPPEYVDYVRVDIYTSDSTGYLDSLTIDVDGTQEYSNSMIYLNEGSNSKTIGVDVPSNGGDVVITASDDDYTEELNGAQAFSHGPRNVDFTANGNTYNIGNISDGQTVTQSISLQQGSNSLSYSQSNLDTAVSSDIQIDYDEVTATENPSLDVDDDGTDEASYSGVIQGGQTQTVSAGGIPLGSQTATTSVSGTTVDWDLTYTERTGTEDPAVDIDGDGTADASASGVLASGETASASLSGLDENSQTVETWGSTAGPAPDWDITYSPRWITENPSLDIDEDGTAEASYSGTIAAGNTQTIAVDGLQDGQSYTATTHLKNTEMAVDWDLSFTEPTAVENPGIDVNGDGTDEATYFGTLDQGENSTESISDGLLSTGSNTLAFSGAGEAYNYSLEATEVYHTEDPDVDVDGDGDYEVTYSGMLAPGETATYDVSDLSLQSDHLAIATNGGSEVIAEAQYRERTQTQDVTVSVNGNPTSYDLTLDEGETQSLAVNESWLVNGTNTVEVSVAPSTGSDAPDGQVGIDYYHTAEDVVETSYSGETWTERYNVSKTWANSKENATLTIPFDSDKVVGIRDVEKSINDSAPTAVDPSNYSLEDTTLTVEFGDVQEGETIAVQANGTKVDVGNGDITVTDPTIEGNELDTSFRIDRHDPGFYMEVSGTATPDRVHHLETLSWTGADPYTEHNADGTQFLYMPNATAGGKATMQTLPLDVDPKTGDVHIALEDDNESNPVFEVEPGDQLGDEVAFTYYNTTSGETYVLDSRTNDIARDTQEAESPVTLVDDDSPEVLEIYEEDQAATGDGGSSGGDTQYISPVESTRAWYESLPIISIGAALALAVVAAIANYLFREWYKILGTVGAAALVELVLLTEFIWPEVILSPLATGIREIAPTIAFILAVTIAYVIYNRWGTITDSGNEDAVTVSDDGVLRIRRK